MARNPRWRSDDGVTENIDAAIVSAVPRVRRRLAGIEWVRIFVFADLVVFAVLRNFEC